MILANEASAGNGYIMLFVVIAMVVVMYLLMIRPQSKERKKIQAMMNDIAPGDAIVTSSGFYGVVIDVSENDVIVEFGNNRNCRIPMQKAAIVQIEKPKGSVPAPEADQDKK